MEKLSRNGRFPVKMNQQMSHPAGICILVTHLKQLSAGHNIPTGAVFIFVRGHYVTLTAHWSPLKYQILNYTKILVHGSRAM